MLNYIKQKSESSEVIICPYCDGIGHKVIETRVSLYDSDFEKKECYLCKGKRVVKKNTTTEYLVVE